MTYSKKPQTSFFNLLISKHLLFFLLISLPGFMQAQWNFLSSPVNYESFMQVVNADTVIYSYGNTGIIYRTVDGGENWTNFDTELEYSWIFDFDFPTDQIGYGCGGTYFGQFNDVVIKTENAGLTWDTLTTNSFGVYTFNQIDFLNIDTGFVSGGSLLLRTQDGGLNFTPIEIVEDGLFSLSKIYATSEGVLFASGQETISQSNYHISIFRSIDLGETWQEVYSDDMEDADNLDNRFVMNIYFPTSETGYAVGGNGLFLKTIDAGLTWEQSFISPFTNLSTVYFTSVDVGYTNNAGGIYKTTDGGVTWEAQNMDVPAIVSDIQFGSENIGYALTPEKLYKTINAGGILAVENPELSDGLSVYPNPARDFVSVNSDNRNLKHIKIIDATGRTVAAVNQGFDHVKLSEIAPGNYLLVIETNEGIVTRKLVVE